MWQSWIQCNCFVRKLTVLHSLWKSLEGFPVCVCEWVHMDIYSTAAVHHEAVGFNLVVCCVACDSFWAYKEPIPLCLIRPIPLCLMSGGAESRSGWLPPPSDLLCHSPLLCSRCGRGCVSMRSQCWCWYWRSSGKVTIIPRAAPVFPSPPSALIGLNPALFHSPSLRFEGFCCCFVCFPFVT